MLLIVENKKKYKLKINRIVREGRLLMLQKIKWCFNIYNRMAVLSRIGIHEFASHIIVTAHAFNFFHYFARVRLIASITIQITWIMDTK